MQVVDFWIPYNFLSLLLFTVGTQHLTKKKKKRKTKSVKLFKCLNKDMVFWLCLSKFEKILPAFKLYFSFLSITVSLSLSLQQTGSWKNEDVQMGCSFSVRLLCKYGIRKRSAWKRVRNTDVHKASQPSRLGCLCIAQVCIIQPRHSRMRPEGNGANG